MTTLLQLRTRIRAAINERVARVVLDSDLNDIINDGVRDFSTRAMWYERIVGMPVVAKQVEYPLATLAPDILKLLMVRWYDRYRLKVIDLSEWAASTYYNSSPSGIPSLASLSPHDKNLRIWAPATSSSVATALSGGGITAVATTIPVTSTAGFPTRGIIRIGTEQIYYDDINATNFLLCRRGDGDTTAAIAAGAAPVTSCPMVLTTVAIPPALSGDTDVVKFPQAYEDDLIYYGAGRAELIRQNQAKSDFYMKLYEKRREEAALEKFWDLADGSPAVKDEETEMGWNGQP